MSDVAVARPSATRRPRLRDYVRRFCTPHDPREDAPAETALPLSDPRVAAAKLAPLLAGELVEVYAVACLSTTHRLLTWHIVARGVRRTAPLSIPDVFVPALITPGTSDLIVVHNHPDGDPTPTAEDARLTIRLCAAANALDLPLLDHLIVCDAGLYFSFRESGRLTAATQTVGSR